MSYCVNCGVELSAGANMCPLCDTPVVNPAASTEKSEPSYPRRMVIPPGVRKQYLGFLLSVILIIPNIVCVLTNMLLPQTGVWSMFVVASSLAVWTYGIIPLFLKKIYPYALLGLDTLVTVVYAFVFYTYFKENGWFFRLALPMILSLALMCLVFMVWYRRKKQDALKCAILIVADIAMFSLLTEIHINAFYGRPLTPVVSVIIAVSCVCLMLFFRATVKSQRFKAWLTRRFYF